MRGLLVDVNVGGLLPYLHRAIDQLGLSSVLAARGLQLAAFGDLIDLPADVDDRKLWTRCQSEGWVLLTENRNRDGADSLEAVLRDSWRIGHLPVLTLANRSRMERDREYAGRIAEDIAELLFGVSWGEYRDQPRIYLPRW